MTVGVNEFLFLNQILKSNSVFVLLDGVSPHLLLLVSFSSPS